MPSATNRNRIQARVVCGSYLLETVNGWQDFTGFGLFFELPHCGGCLFVYGNGGTCMMLAL
jgi:hypothetical protein